MMFKDDGGDGSSIAIGHDDPSTSSRVETPHDADQPKEAENIEEAVNRLISKETKGILVWKVATLMTIVALGSVVTAVTHMLVVRIQNATFEANFELLAQTIYDAMENHVTNVNGNIRDGSELITVIATSSGQEFPFVTIPSFEIIGQQIRTVGDHGSLATVYWSPRVLQEQHDEWIEYSNQNVGWLNESRAIALERSGGLNADLFGDTTELRAQVWAFTPDGTAVPTFNRFSMEPQWQSSPPPKRASVINLDLNSWGSGPANRLASDDVAAVVFSEIQDVSAYDGLYLSRDEHEKYLVRVEDNETIDRFSHPHAFMTYAIYETTASEKRKSNVVGHIASMFTWDLFLVDLLPEGVSGITAVLENTCNQRYTYEVEGKSALFRGEGDHHDMRYDYLRREVPFYPTDDAERTQNYRTRPGQCVYYFSIYPTEQLEELYSNNMAIIASVGVVATFGLLIGVFFAYDHFVNKRNAKMHREVNKSNAIVSSLFPSNIRDRLYAEVEAEEETRKTKNGKNRLKTFLSDDNSREDPAFMDDDAFYKTKPIADLFPETTVLFADICGFTSWSSTREPTQVFILLETIYKAFDDIAKARRIYKVETVGDCYVAVAGLPDPRKDHAVAMARFAISCMYRMHNLTKLLEMRLGPDTAELDIRVGLHSGPVTAGVLRGERSRFQLFGDTMNTASRMESTGRPGMIQVSPETAALLVEHGKKLWLKARDDTLVVKGKGEMHTFWLSTKRRHTESVANSESALSEGTEPGESACHGAKTERLVTWIVTILAEELLKVVQNRGTVAKPLDPSDAYQVPQGNVLDEVQEIISLPSANPRTRGTKTSPANQGQPKQLTNTVMKQLTDYVTEIAAIYRSNPFHNFEHASHVTSSVVKLMSRIVTPDVETCESEADLHKFTYGITSDPLTQFACVFSALIHDVDHNGVPNTRLVIEDPALAALYNNKSIAEQNSVDLAWKMLEDPRFDELRSAICFTRAEQKRFRQLVVNSVMATDIMDRDLKKLRNARWDRAFKSTDESTASESLKDATDRKATIVIEHLIQASDVVHTMQHWHVYRKWNERLFEENYNAYKTGRAPSNPADGWYKGELWFFDNYIIPLARKLKECGVFGVSSDEYLNYAIKNREEFALMGQEIVAEMVHAYDENGHEVEAEMVHIYDEDGDE